MSQGSRILGTELKIRKVRDMLDWTRPTSPFSFVPFVFLSCCFAFFVFYHPGILSQKPVFGTTPGPRVQLPKTLQPLSLSRKRAHNLAQQFSQAYGPTTYKFFLYNCPHESHQPYSYPRKVTALLLVGSIII